MLIHGTCVEIDGAGVLICGPSGCGKSDLALRLIEYHGARLVADDQVEVTVEPGEVFAAVPEALAGLLEVRGIGIVKVHYCNQARLALAVDLCARDMIARMPEPEWRTIGGHAIPLVRLYPHDASAPAKLRLMLDRARTQEEGHDDV